MVYVPKWYWKQRKRQITRTLIVSILYTQVVSQRLNQSNIGLCITPAATKCEKWKYKQISKDRNVEWDEP